MPEEKTNDDIFLLERSNSRRIERLESDVNEIRQDIAAMPGRIVTELEKRHPTSERFNALAWAFGVILTIVGAISWNFYTADTAMSNSLDKIASHIANHVHDGHPTRVEEKVVLNAQNIDKTFALHGEQMLTLKDLESRQAESFVRITALEKEIDRQYDRSLITIENKAKVQQILSDLKERFEILRKGQEDRFTGQEALQLEQKLNELYQLIIESNVSKTE